MTWKDGSPVIAPNAKRAREFVEGELALTRLGREVLAGKKDWQQINRKTRWLGGVEIAPGKDGWRWDPTERQIVRQDSAPAAKKPRKTSRRRPRKKK